MLSMGVRPMNGGIHWVVVEGTRDAAKLVATGKIEKPRTFDDNRALNHLREKFRAVLQKHAETAAVNVRDNDAALATKKFYPRVRAEAIVLEATIAEGKTPAVLNWSAIASSLGIPNKRDKKKAYMDADEFRGVNCSTFGTEARDALHAAVAGLPK